MAVKYRIEELTYSTREDISQNEESQSTVDCYLVVHALYVTELGTEGSYSCDLQKLATKVMKSDGVTIDTLTKVPLAYSSVAEVEAAIKVGIENQIDSDLKDKDYQSTIKEALSQIKSSSEVYSRDSFPFNPFNPF